MSSHAVPRQSICVTSTGSSPPDDRFGAVAPKVMRSVAPTHPNATPQSHRSRQPGAGEETRSMMVPTGKPLRGQALAGGRRGGRTRDRDRRAARGAVAHSRTSRIARSGMGTRCPGRASGAPRRPTSPLPRRRCRVPREPVDSLVRMRHEAAVRLVVPSRAEWHGGCYPRRGPPLRDRRTRSHGRRHRPAPYRHRSGGHGPRRPHGPQQVIAALFHRSPRPSSHRAIRPTSPNPPQPSAPSADRRGAPPH